MAWGAYNSKFSFSPGLRGTPSWVSGLLLHDSSHDCLAALALSESAPFSLCSRASRSSLFMYACSRFGKGRVRIRAVSTRIGLGPRGRTP